MRGGASAYVICKVVCSLKFHVEESTGGASEIC